MAQLCVTIARRRHRKVFEEMVLGTQMGARMLEIRLDYPREPRLSEILEQRTCPLVATCRRQQDGGLWTGQEPQRLKLLRSAIADGFDYVDLEIDVADRISRYGNSKRIISYHNLQCVPENLEDIHQRMTELDPDIVKLACRANDPSDNFSMFRLMQKSKIPMIGICMGDFGVASRVLGGKFGAPFTFCALSSERLPALGMLTYAELTNLYYFEQINERTEVYAVIGDPIRHSLSPLVHNAAFRESGLNKAYVPFRVPVESLDRFLEQAGGGMLRGISVTIPHKEAVLGLGQTSDPLVQRCGAANTLLWADNHWDLFNTDGPAAVAALRGVLPADGNGSSPFEGRLVHLIGAGGAARTIAHTLHHLGALVSISNRTHERAADLAREVGCKTVEWSERLTRHSDILINCTPVGMFPKVNESPMPPNGIHEGTIVFDTVYNPENTLLLRHARARSCRTVTGVEMFVRQAEDQFRLFTNMSPPEGLMAQLVREELSPARNMLREVRLAGKNA